MKLRKRIYATLTLALVGFASALFADGEAQRVGLYQAGSVATPQGKVRCVAFLLKFPYSASPDDLQPDETNFGYFRRKAKEQLNLLGDKTHTMPVNQPHYLVDIPDFDTVLVIAAKKINTNSIIWMVVPKVSAAMVSMHGEGWVELDGKLTEVFDTFNPKVTMSVVTQEQEQGIIKRAGYRFKVN